jgi:predicted metal-dependent HD superfamily phosphohydrolase
VSDAALERELTARWSADLGHRGPATDALRSLLARHAEPHRRYHTAVHVAHVLRGVQRLGDAAGLDVASARTVRLAAWYHDVVYDPRAGAGANEEASAALAERTLVDLGEAAGTAAEVARLIRLTAGHEPAADDLIGAVLIDADLGVLGAEPASYQAYVNGVRAEYAHVDEAGWRTGRAAVLRGFLERPRLFRLDVEPGRERRARANLTAELSGLTAPPPASVGRA